MQEILKTARLAILDEAEAIRKLAEYIDNDFAAVVKLISSCKGRLIVTGIGKSAIIANKIVATLNSTGTPSMFMHAADAIHGDLGMITDDDIVMCISKSGNTPEIKVLIPLLRRSGNRLIAMVSDTRSHLAEKADYVLKASVEREACPNNLAPTSSTTAQLVLGDALAICLMRCKNFVEEDFARFHPGGSLGKKMYMRVSDICASNNPPRVLPDTSIQDTIIEISSKRLGATAVTDTNNNLLGVITDGDLRRMLQKYSNLQTLKAKDVMTISPKVIKENALAIKAFNMMESNSITQLVVVKDEQYVGIIHIHDILREGIV